MITGSRAGSSCLSAACIQPAHEHARGLNTGLPLCRLPAACIDIEQNLSQTQQLAADLQIRQAQAAASTSLEALHLDPNLSLT